MKIYYATSIRGEQKNDLTNINKELINHLKNYGEVLTEHFANANITGKGETEFSDSYIHDRDIDWLLSADVIVAEVSNLSLGVGYEIGRAVEHNKNIICLRKKSNIKLSAMISGCKALKLKEYDTTEEAIKAIDDLLN